MSENAIINTINVDDLKTKCFNSITELFEKYKDHEYMLQRINTHIVNYLPNTLEIEFKKFILNKFSLRS